MNHRNVSQDGRSFADLEGAPDWLVDDLMSPGGLMRIEGLEGTHKTWLALELVRAVATGQRFAGCFATRGAGVLAVLPEAHAEDLRDRWRRLIRRDLESPHRQSFEQAIEQRVRFSCVPFPDEDSDEAWTERLHAWVRSCDIPVEVLVVDSIAPRDSKDATAVERRRLATHAFAQATGIAVVLTRRRPAGGRRSPALGSDDGVRLELEPSRGTRSASKLTIVRAGAHSRSRFRLRFHAEFDRVELRCSELAASEESLILEFIQRQGGRMTRGQCIEFLFRRTGTSSRGEWNSVEGRVNRVLKRLVAAGALRNPWRGLYVEPDPDATSGAGRFARREAAGG